MAQELPPRKRRVRYSGTHPRRFDEKYKELNPERYTEDVQKVLESGKTPAGMHRPICVNEILDILKPQAGETGLDATLGYGGHTQELLARIAPGGRLFAFDVDPLELPRTEARLRALGHTPDTLIIRRTNFAGIAKLLADVPEGLDFVLADLGVSSMQIDNPARGFTFKADGPLDLRLNPLRGLPASALLKTISKEKLAALLQENADEPCSEEIAQAITESRELPETTLGLAAVIRRVLETLHSAPPPEDIKKAQQRTFQALRIAVNDEFGALDRFLELLPSCLSPGGRAAILTFHSGEDRRVKKSFQKFMREGVYSDIAPDPIRPSAGERRDNPRSSCAKLRWAVKK